MEVNKSHFIAAGIGFLMGVCLTVGIVGIMGTKGGVGVVTSSNPPKESKYDKVPADPDGDAYITPSGGKYHSLRCGHLNRVPDRNVIKRVDSHKAEEVGLTRCRRFYK